MSTQQPFGIEHTELYFSHASARIKNHPKYVDAILNRGLKPLKGDRKSLNVLQLQLSSGEGDPFKNLKVVTLPDPGVEGFQEVFKERMREKIRKYPPCQYPIDLVVHDRESYIKKGMKTHAAQFFFSDTELCALLMKSAFREVFYLGEYEGENVYIPLKAALFITHVGLFYHFFANQWQEQASTSAERLATLHFVLTRLGHREFNVRGGQQGELFLIRHRTVVNVTSPVEAKIVLCQKAFLRETCGIQLPAVHTEQNNRLFASFLAFAAQHIIHFDHFVFPTVQKGKEAFFQ